MLKVPKRSHLLVIVAMAFTATTFAGSVAAGSALADNGDQGESSETPVTLKGDWAAFTRCPVDDPTILAADGKDNIALCLAMNSPNGSLTIGGLTVPTKATNVQFGLVLSNVTGGSTAVSPPDGALLDESIEIPNGLPALICPSQGHFARRVCRTHHHGEGDGGDEGSRELNLTISTESAGNLSHVNLLDPTQPLLSLPIKIHLENRLLGRHCYIGSDSEPIVLQPENAVPPTFAFESFDVNGTPDPSGGVMTLIKITGTSSASSFAVPVATGCGHMGIFDEVINHNVGLPSAAGKNKFVLNETTVSVAGLSNPGPIVPNDGKELSKNWHSAVAPEAHEEEGNEEEEQEEDRRHRHEHGH